MRSLALLVVAACASAPRSAAPPARDRTLRYVVVTSGRAAGYAYLTIEASGRRTSHFQFNDRGRGPDVRTVVELDAGGAPRALFAEGNDYFKAQVDEHLETKDGQLVWRSTSEKGQAPAGAGFYLPLAGPHDILAIVGAAARRAPGHRLRLLPSGEVWLGEETTLDVELAGRTRHLRRLAIEGLGFSPSLVWIDEDGQYFAEVTAWTSVIAAGAEELIPRLLAEDQRFSAARAARLARELVEAPPAAGLAIQHARLFDPVKRATTDDVTVIVAGDRIVAVGGPATPVPAGARTIDARGRTLLPGLWDMHVHLGDDAGLFDLAVGVTTVRDMGNEIDSLAARVARFDSGAEIGPRVLRAGLIDAPGPTAAPIGLFVSTPDEARAAVARFADLGYAQIKIYSSLDPALVPVIAAETHARKLRLSGHVPNGLDATRAVELGFDEIQHANFLFLPFLEGAADTRGPARFTLVAQLAAALDLDSPPVRKLLDLLVARHTVLDPTLVAFEAMFVSEPADLTPLLAPFADRLPAQVLRGSRGGGLPAPDGMRPTFRASHAALGKMVKRAWDRGITIVAGTDSFPGLSLPRELQLYAAAGIPPADVLALATLGAARVMGKEAVSGSVAPGKQADLVLVDGDPVRDLSALLRADLVVCRGRVYDPARLFRAVGMKPR